jgi:hypothetical protein
MQKAAILFRGESFRFGGQNSRNIGDPKAVLEQVKALENHIEFIQHIERKYKIQIDVFIDTQSTPFNNTILNVYKKYNKKIIEYQFNTEYAKSQGESIQRGINKIVLSQNYHNYISFFITRIDLLFSQTFFEMFDPFCKKIMFPSITWYHWRKTLLNSPRINDVFFYLPQKYNQLLHYFKIIGSHGHDILDAWNFNGSFEWSLYLKTYHDSDTEKDWNPLYSIINRNKSNQMYSDKKMLYPNNF